ncbi:MULTISPECIES: M28 family metallopeptidase [unclassified Haladaptatus]|uniref:M20/M25/M40 family metallo-hydrolase n=1 Tax=unclassified Haladaptatus TaxID=2622732 RepID=UPI00209BFEBF|nr:MULTISPECIES: M28 family metallopeptidase [unclassified Haladaptatus]MCO8245884.1 M28 family metallopeptidase [Haladaptatus sp. AB643]MCO8254496.1 M28 family metallopeptidase [Haladaptatus sp. AB618]
MSQWIGRTFTSDAGWNFLETIVDIGDRMTGSDGEREAAEVTRDTLTDVGARNARLAEFDVQGWTRGTSSITAGDTTQESIALPRSPAGSASGELIDLGYGLPSDFEKHDIEGKVVMVASNVPSYFDRFIHRREKYYYAVDGGAAAFVFRNHVEGCLPPTGSVGTEEDPIGDIPAVGVSKEVGTRLARRWDGDEVTVDVDAEIYDATSQNVHAELGPDTEQEVLVTSHIDAHDIAEGAMDNGAGTAMVVEIARALAEREDELDTKVHFVAFGAEEVGLDGSAHMASQTDFDGIKAILNNDGVGRGRTLTFTTHGFDALDDAAHEVADEYGHPISTIPHQGPHSDHWPFVQWGVPGYHVGSETGDEGRGWGHTFADTLDKLEVRDLREQAILLTDLAVHLASDDYEVEHKDPEEIADALEAEDQAAGMKIIGDWPYDD